MDDNIFVEILKKEKRFNFCKEQKPWELFLGLITYGKTRSFEPLRLDPKWGQANDWYESIRDVLLLQNFRISPGLSPGEVEAFSVWGGSERILPVRGDAEDIGALGQCWEEFAELPRHWADLELFLHSKGWSEYLANLENDYHPDYLYGEDGSLVWEPVQVI